MPFFGLSPVEVGRLATVLLGRTRQVPDSYQKHQANVILPEPTGEVGKMNTRAEDLDAYARGIQKHMKRLGIEEGGGLLALKKAATRHE